MVGRSGRRSKDVGGRFAGDGDCHDGPRGPAGCKIDVSPRTMPACPQTTVLAWQVYFHVATCPIIGFSVCTLVVFDAPCMMAF